MERPPIPPDEERRLASLRATGVLDSSPEDTFDAIVELARHVTQTPIALVSLVDAHRQWFKAKVGIAVPETPRELAFCAHAINDHRPLVIADALADLRFADNPLVLGDPNIRFYAGIPLVLDDGSAIGTLCVLDHVPRAPEAHQIGALTLLARQISTELSLRRRMSSAALSELEARQPPSGGGSDTDGGATPAGHATHTMRPAAALRDTTPVAMPSGPRDELTRGLLAGRYRIEQSLGGGGMGVVVGAVGPDGERVAVKFLRDAAATDPQMVDRFAREAEVLMRVHSPHVTRVLDVGNFANGKPFIVMEWLSGEDLADRLIYDGKIAPDESVAIVRQVCLGAEAVHAAGVIHRDIKPSNIFLAQDASLDARGFGIAKLLDFGVSGLIAPKRSEQSRLTVARSTLGTPAYMAPEQVFDPRLADARSDVWAITVVFYQMLTAELPPERDSDDDDAYEQRVQAQLVDVHGLSPGLAAVVSGGLRWDRKRRTPSPRAIIEGLDALTTLKS